MSGEIRFTAEDHEKANCKGINTDLFFMEDELLKGRYLTVRYMRKVCFMCPIRRKCYQYGYTKERYGMFGGVTSWERKEIATGQRDGRFLQALRNDLTELGVDVQEVLDDSKIKRNLNP